MKFLKLPILLTAETEFPEVVYTTAENMGIEPGLAAKHLQIETEQHSVEVGELYLPEHSCSSIAFIHSISDDISVIEFFNGASLIINLAAAKVTKKLIKFNEASKTRDT